MHTFLHINLAYQKEQQGNKKNPILLVLILTTQPLSPNWHALCCCQVYCGLAAHTQNFSAAVHAYARFEHHYLLRSRLYQCSSHL